MKFRIEKKDLLDLIIPAQAACSTKATLPALEGLLLSVTGDTIVISGYDLEKGVRAEGVIMDGEDGEIILNAQKFVAIIRNMPDNDQIIFISDDKNNATVSGGNAEFNIHGIPASAFPTLPELDNDTSFSISQRTLKELITTTIFSVAQNDTRPILTGELLKIEGSNIAVVAIDNCRMAIRHAYNAIINNTENYSVVVPGKALSELVRLLSDSEEQISIELTRKNIVFKLKNIIMFTRLLEGEFLDFENLIPKSPKIFMKVPTIALLDSVERVSLMVDEKLKTPIKCVITDRAIEISCANQFGKVVDIVPIEKQGIDLEIGFNNKYIIDAMRFCKSELIDIELTTALMGMVIKPAVKDENSDYTYMVLPCRIK
ncbi:MAG: DNA polymerase III subunit beta [Clostridiales bacterium GWF2_38_85]|nr:MAG: DNA polymerase III subunit beta [Clostridiales bacterium GWF2_38_85]HBL85475.1 DNA polymerase III subunit beta [Clostridiales bacterium]